MSRNDDKFALEAKIETFASMITNIQQWLVILGFNAQLLQFNQEILRLTLRTGDADGLFVVCRRWGNFIEPYMKQHEAKIANMVTVDAVIDRAIDVKVLA